MKFFSNSLEGNISKIFLFNLSQRRHFITLLSLYFLILDNTTAQQIGLYTAIANLLSFFLEVPSGYLSDRLGHKNTLIFAKILMVFSMLFFIFGTGFWFFLIGSCFLSASFAFTSGTQAAFFHETMISLKRDKEFSKLWGKIRANVSLVSMFFIILLPFFTQIFFLLPFYINLGFDLIGLFVAFSLKNPNSYEKIDKNNSKSIYTIVKNLFSKNFYPIAFFSSAITGFLIGIFIFREIHLVSLGFPVAFIGFVMGLSRFVWFIVGNKFHIIEDKFSFKQILIFEMIFFPGVLILLYFIFNPYIAAFLIILVVGYQWGRNQIYHNYFLNNCMDDKKYKATVMSIANQLSLFLQFVVPLGLSIIVSIYSYGIGFLVSGVFLFCFLLVSFLFYCKKD